MREVLEDVNADGPDGHGCYVVELEDGGRAEVLACGLEAGRMVSLGGITPGLSRFLYDLLRAGNWVMLPAVEDGVAITASPGGVKGIRDGFPRVVACDSVQELAVLLSGVWRRGRSTATE